MTTKESRPFLREVEEFFVATVRRGLVLRPADVETAKDWEARGVPFEVVRRGILLGLRQFLQSAEPHEPLPTSLRYYRRRVEEEFRAWQRAVGRGLIVPRPTGEGHRSRDLHAAARTFLEARRSETSGESKAAIDRCLSRLTAIRAGETLHAVLLELDEILLAGAIADAPPDVRAAIETRARALAEDARKRGLGPQAISEVEFSARRAAAAAQADFRSVVEAVLQS